MSTAQLNASASSTTAGDTRPLIAVVFGGRSSEHAISCATASGVLGAIDREKYRVLPIGITRDGAWVLEDDDADKFALDPENLPEVVDNGTRIHLPDSAKHREVTVSRVEGDAHGAEAGAERTERTSLGEVDLVFPILHGPFGEDGTVQGMLELVGLPFVGSSVLAASVGMDKHYTKIVLRDAGLQVADGVTISQHQWDTRGASLAAETVDRLGLPVFVKPARAGSSVGVSKVAALDEFAAAMTTALAEDDHVLVEAAVVGREVEIAVLESRPGERARASVAGEIVMTKAEFYDFEAKYLDDSGVELRCPAELSDELLAEMAELGVRAFEALGASGLARVDFFLTDDGFVVNEINTMPGFTPISMFPKCWQASGMSYPQLITELIEVASAHAAAREARLTR